MAAIHPWHDVSPGNKIPFLVNGIIEIPMGSKAKYEVDKPTGLLRLDRVLFSSVYYPANYGFIPKTYCGDHDPLDILVISSIEMQPLCMVEAKVIGVMHMLDQGEHDDKIIAVANNDMSVNYINDVSELPPHTEIEIIRFFEDYKKLENKEVVVKEFSGKEVAFLVINESLELYTKTFVNH